jgi:TolA-binding protein
MSAKDLFEQAEAYRLEGHPREAAAALDRLRRSFPRDPRAGLASFELGRLRMDQLGDPAGALNAFSDAMRLDPSARFREDAQARVVQLYASLGQSERCLKAQAEYQSRYPNGSHAKSVAGSCKR